MTFTVWLRELADTWADEDAVVEPGGESVSFAVLERRVAALAGGLSELGLGRGDRLASFVPNGVRAVELMLAAARLGAVTVGVNTRYRSEDLRHLLERARPRLVAAVPEFLGIDFRAVVASAVSGLENSPRVLWPDDVSSLMDRCEPLGEDRARPTDMAVAFTTSGTTGRPKLAAHDHATTIRHLQAAASSMETGHGSTSLVVLPFCGTFGFVSLMAALAGGGRVIVPDHFDPAGAAALLERYGVTHLNGSDDMLLAVLDRCAAPASWRYGVHAEFAGRGEEAVLRADEAGVTLTGVYGSSETFALLARRQASADRQIRARNGGVTVDPAMQARVTDTVTGAEVPQGQPGELQLRGPSVLGGYLEPDRLAPPPLTAEGWFATGDLACMDRDGGFTYLARLGDALRLAGFLTDPAEIEQHLLAHPRVLSAQVVGAPAASGGEVAVAFVVADGEIDEKALIAHCRKGLANYKTPARVVAIDEFPVVDGANGTKIRKTELRQLAARLISEG